MSYNFLYKQITFIYCSIEAGCTLWKSWDIYLTSNNKLEWAGSQYIIFQLCSGGYVSRQFIQENSSNIHFGCLFIYLNIICYVFHCLLTWCYSLLFDTANRVTCDTDLTSCKQTIIYKMKSSKTKLFWKSIQSVHSHQAIKKINNSKQCQYTNITRLI